MDGNDQPGELMAVEVSPALAAMLERFPLRAGIHDADMNQDEIAAAFNTTVNTVAKWIKQDGMPVAQLGGLGKPYVLRLSHCYAWKMARDADLDQRARHNKDAVSRMQAEFLGLDVEDPQAMLSAKDRRALADADIVHSRAMQLRRQLVPLADMVDLLEAVLKIVRDGIEAMPDRLERELSLKPEQVAAVMRVGEDVLQAMAGRIEEEQLAERDVPEVEVQQAQWTI